MPSSASQDTRPPAFQFYPKDFLTDSNVVVMSLQERGAYITLICQCWIEGSIPADHTRLARLCGSPLPTFRRLWPALAPCFKPAKDDSQLIHPRLERERKKQLAWRAEQAERGKQGAEKRWRKHGAAMPTPSKPNGAAINSPMAKNGSSSSSASSSADSSQKSVRALVPSGAIGTIHRGGHHRHSWCSERICVPDFIHDRLRRQLGRADADSWLKGWYQVVVDRSDAPIGEKPEDFWPREFAAEFPPAAGVSKLTAALQKASDW